jgi:endoribonuclease Dicer
VADVAEAIIGAAYISGGRETALKVTKALNIPVPNIDCWSDFSRKVLAPPPNVTAKVRPGSIAAVEAIIGHKFNHPHLLAQALVGPLSCFYIDAFSSSTDTCFYSRVRIDVL